MQLSNEVKEILLLVARGAIKSHFSEIINLKLDYSRYPELLIKDTGAFVTLTRHNELRGCIGFLEAPKKRLIDTIYEAARRAAFNDPRFHPLSIEELPDIKIEISILSKFSLIKSYDEIKLGIHGLLLDEETTRALLLPQVATEYNFSLQQFLTAICQKGGINSNEWQIRFLNLKVFTATIFSETKKKNESYETI
ncbi:MAG: AmmeMemoRadiSam system protein A [Ignavibacteriaceae bacterium]|nr:AmmeMemoRadiSam system protein A [Ignavibacteriaceae bacterium]